MSKVYTLEQLCLKITDGSHSSPKESKDGYPMLSVKDMEEFDFSFSSVKTISEEDFLKLVKQGCKPEVNDVLVAKDGSVMKHIFSIEEERDIVLLSSIAILKPNLELVNPKYLVILLKRNAIKQNILNNYVSGSGVPRIVLKDFKKIELDIPELDIQNKIVDIVYSFNNKLKLNTQINQTLEQIAQTIFKSWFIDFDPVHAKAEALANGQTAEQTTQAAMAVIRGKNTQELHRLQTANPEQYQQLWEIADAFPSGVDEEGVPVGWTVKRIEDVIRKIPTGKNIAKKQLLKLEMYLFWIRENRV